MNRSLRPSFRSGSRPTRVTSSTRYGLRKRFRIFARYAASSSGSSPCLALSAAEVAALASGQAGSGDVVHYAFDEAGGATLVDSSGVGRNGTVVAGSSATTAPSRAMRESRSAFPAG